MIGDVRGRRILDAGCGHGYLSRMLAARGARVTGVEPAQALYDYAKEKEAAQPLGIRSSRPICAGFRTSAGRSTPSSPAWSCWTFRTGRGP
jgi:cyclopropane fatty-acyl-phospholipid synthase-like methyltransferase